MKDDLLIEIHTEELPPKGLQPLADAFCQQMKERLEKSHLTFDSIEYFAAPRRIALHVKNIDEKQPDQLVERKGPALAAAFDAAGNPSKACMGFAKSLGVEPKDLMRIKTQQGEWVGFKQNVEGKTLQEVVPTLLEEVVKTLPIPRRMRWNDGDTQFVRPVHAVVLLFGDQVLKATVLGCETGRTTRGHRFLSPGWITIPHAAAYLSLLKTEGSVLADFNERREKIIELAKDVIQKKLNGKAEVLFTSDEFLNEVTGLSEWPNAICGTFDEAFLDLPKEVLISAMEIHQRYFPVIDVKTKALLPYFVTISNIQSHDISRVQEGNERVLRARLKDAQFFYATDKEERLDQRLERLRGIIFQAKLGTLFDRAERLARLSTYLAARTNRNQVEASRAGLLAKTDLTTNMVNEFPELQGVMGSYYAKHDGESENVVQAIGEQYHPRFAGDTLPQNPIAELVSLADRIDTLVGTFGINQVPTGDKDPYGLRRAAIGLLRILIEKRIDLDLEETLQFAAKNYSLALSNSETVPQILAFLQDRQRALYLEQGIAPDVFAAVAALNIANPMDMDARIQAVMAFKQLNEAETLSIANKRVSNILAKYTDTLSTQTVNPAIFENQAEEELARQLDEKEQQVRSLHQTRKYDKELVQLAELRKPIDDFFDQVMVMTDDKSRRENRILLLSKLRSLFLQVADIALLQ